MKILSLNTWGCRITENLFSYIKENSKDTDIFCFQEISKGGKGRTEKNEIKDAFEQLNELLPDYSGYFWEYGEEGHYYDKRKDEIDFDFGVACFVRKNFHQELKGEIHLYDPKIVWSDYSGRFAAGAVLAVKVEGFVVLNVHGMWQGSIKEDTEAKIAQSKQIIELAESLGGKKIICGDFNLLPHTKSIGLFQDKYVDLIKKYHITDTRGNLYTKDLRYSDYVFIDKSINDQKFLVPKVELSDHLPLLLSFE